jgi:uncharacterized MAPEG superfamily protein
MIRYTVFRKNHCCGNDCRASGKAMTIAEWCVFGALLLSLLTITTVKWMAFRQFDNSKPRDPTFYADPIRARALGAHQNGMEAFPFFAVAVLLAEFHSSPQRLNWRCCS